MAVDVGSAVGYLDLDISGFLANLRSAQSEADTTSRSIATRLETNLKGVGKSLTSAGKTLTKSVTTPLVAIGTVGLKTASDFESAMSNVKAISGATGDEFGALRQQAIDLGGSTAFSATEVADAMTEMAKAGWSTNQIMVGMGGVLDAAAASGESLGSVSTIVADAITGFGMAASDSTRVADLLTQAANSGTIGVSDLGESFKYVAPIAASMGFSIEDTTTAITAMSMAGIKGSQAGTSLRTMLTRLIKPNDNVAGAMEQLGIKVANADGTMKSLDTVIAELRASFEGLTDEEKAQYAATLAGQEGMSGLLSILNLTQAEYDAIAASMDNANGIAKKTAEVMRDNLGADVEELTGSLESLAITLAEHLMPHIRSFVRWLTGLVAKFTALDPEMQKTILKIAGIAAVTGPTLIVLGKLTKGVGSIIAVFGKLKGIIPAVKAGLASARVAIAGVSAPAVAVVAVIGALIAAFVTLWKTNEDFRNKMAAIWEQIKGTFEKLCQGIVDRLNKLGLDFENIGEVLKAIWEGFCNFLAPIFEGVFQQIATVFDMAVNVLLGILDFFVSIFTGDWEGAWNAIKGVFESIWNGIVATFQNIGNILVGILNVICSWFGTTWETTWSNIKQFFVDAWGNILSFFAGIATSITTAVSNFVSTITGFFTSLFTNIGTFITDTWNSVTTWGSDMVAKAVEVGQGFVDGIVGFFTDLPGKILGFITSAFDSVKTWVTDMTGKASEMGANFVNNVTTFFADLPGNVKEFLDSAVTNAADWVVSMAEKGTEAIEGLIDNVVNGAKDIGSKVLTIGGDIVNGVWDGIKNAATSFKDNVTGFFSDTISSVKNFLGIGSPSKVFRDEIGKWLPPGVAEGFKAALPGAMSSIEEDLNKGIDALSPNDVSVTATATAIGFKDMLKSVYNDLAAYFESVEARIGRSVTNMAASLTYLINQGQMVVNSDGTLGYVGYGGFTGNPNYDKYTERDGPNKPKVSEGDTFIFNSPKAIDEIEAARQMRQTKQDMAEGF